MSGKTAAERIAEKAARLAGGQSAAAPAPVEPKPQVTNAPAPTSTTAPAGQVNAKPVRSTVDLAPLQHNRLKAWCNEAAVQLGRTRVTTQDVMRTMVELLLDDKPLTEKTLAEAVRKGLAQ